MTPLHWSIAYGQDLVFKTVETLIGFAADVSAADEYGLTPLHLAVDRGDFSVVKLLLDNNACVNTNTKNADTPLANAAYRGHLDIIKLLIEAGADVNQQGQNGSALEAAASCGYQEIVSLILQQSVDFTKVGKALGTALHEAAYHGKPAVVEQLLQAGFSVDTRGGKCETPLQAAAAGCYDAFNRDGCLEVARLLLRNGADVNAQGGHFCTALQAAAIYGHREMIDLFLSAGADKNILGGAYGSAFLAAMEFGEDDVIARLAPIPSPDSNQQQLAVENSSFMLQEPTDKHEWSRQSMYLWWERQKCEIPSYHFIRAVEGKHYHRVNILICGVEESFKMAISLKRKRALNQMTFIAKDGFTKVAKMKEQRVLSRLIRAAMTIMCYAIEKGDKEITETLANDWVEIFQATNSNDIDNPITQIVITLLEKEVNDILYSGERKYIESLMEAGLEIFTASEALANPLLPKILREQLVKSWQGAIDRDVGRDIEEFFERRTKEFARTIASGLTKKIEKMFRGTMIAFLAAYNDCHVAVMMKLAKALITGLNSARNANRKLLDRGIKEVQDEFSAAVQDICREETTQDLLKLTTTLILIAKEEGFSELENILCRSFVQSIADAKCPGYLALVKFVNSNGKSNLLQKRDLVKVGESLRKAARSLGQAEVVKYLELEIPLEGACDDEESVGF